MKEAVLTRNYDKKKKEYWYSWYVLEDDDSSSIFGDASSIPEAYLQLESHLHCRRFDRLQDVDREFLANNFRTQIDEILTMGEFILDNFYQSKNINKKVKKK